MPCGGLVDGNLGDIRSVDPRSPLSNVVVNHPPQPSVVLAHHPGHGLDRHGGDHAHQQRLEQKREATVWPRPWHADRLDAAPIAADAWHAGVEISLLEEVEMAPGLPLGVVGRAVRRAAGRTGKSAAWCKVDLDVQPVCLGVEVGAGHRPRRIRVLTLASCSRFVSRKAIAPLCARPVEPGAVLAAVKDAARRASAVAKPSLTAAVRDVLGTSGRDEETAPWQPNQETPTRWAEQSGEARGGRNHPPQTARKQQKHCH